MRISLSVCLFFSLALFLGAEEVLVLTPEQETFMRLTPAERRELFTNEAYRASLAVHDWEKMSWRESGLGENDRWRHLPGVPNMRDLGGLVGLDGRRVRRGLVFRSGGYNSNACELYSEKEVLEMYEKGTLLKDVPAASRAAAEKIAGLLDKGEKEKADLRHLVKVWCPGKLRLTETTRCLQRCRFGIKTDIDLRSDRECYGMSGSPLGEDVTFAHHPYKAYAGVHSDEGKKAFARIFPYFLDRKNYPIGFHCIAGADRTGSLAYILQALLGVSDADLVLDWELTAFHNPNHKFAHAERYDRLTAGFGKYPGATTRERVEAYVREQGFTDRDLRLFRDILLEPALNQVRKKVMSPIDRE